MWNKHSNCFSPLIGITPGTFTRLGFKRTKLHAGDEVKDENSVFAHVTKSHICIMKQKEEFA